MAAINNLWKSVNEHDWKIALKMYWSFVRPENMKLENELNDLSLDEIARLDLIGWYDFLHDKYFRWKYTAPNRYASTTLALKRYKESNQLDSLFEIKTKLLDFNISNISVGLSIASEIHGLGIAGASGLLSLMYPGNFATVDQFVVKALNQIQGFSGSTELKKIKPESLTLKDGVILIHIMKRKAEENNKAFATDFWTPRKIDMVLWAARS
jgi:hypothetical protein